MEVKLAAALALDRGAYVLDAGCGVGHLAIHLVTDYGYQVHEIDIVDHHILSFRRNICRLGLSDDQFPVRKTDYHH